MASTNPMKSGNHVVDIQDHANAALDVTALYAEWTRHGVDSTKVVVNFGGTICPRQRAEADVQASFSEVVAQLPKVLGAAGPLVVFGAELGRGGMGVVRLAQQKSLNREVAVKTTLEPLQSVATQALLREAWISGQLEHPNVIPVYALYRNEQAPLMLMKRVEGRSWTETIAADPTLEIHLRILTQLCHAVHYAHIRGFVHLDLKPNNVMVGNFGEIYLIDWGISASLRDDLPGFIPRASEMNDICGTPAYMSPEQARGNVGAIGPHTDVYLLGAVLHELLLGRPPHLGENMLACIMAAYNSLPHDYPDSVPTELAAIANKAMRREPSERYASVSDLREALEGYLVHSDSLVLTQLGRERHARVCELLHASPLESHTADAEQLATEAEFAFRQALHVWPTNSTARSGLQQLLETLIQADLRRGNWRVALRRLPSLPDPLPDLERRTEELQREETERVHELRRLKEDANLGQAARARSVMAYIGSSLWALSLVGLALLDRFGVMRVDHPHLLGVTLFAGVAFSTIVFLARRDMFANAVNRSVVGLLAMGWFFGVLFWVGAWLVDTPFHAAVIGIGPLIAIVVAAAATTVDQRLIPHAAVAVVGAMIHPFVVPFALEWLGVIGAIVLTMLGITWRDPPKKAS